MRNREYFSKGPFVVEAMVSSLIGGLKITLDENTFMIAAAHNVPNKSCLNGIEQREVCLGAEFDQLTAQTKPVEHYPPDDVSTHFISGGRDARYLAAEFYEFVEVDD